MVVGMEEREEPSQISLKALNILYKVLCDSYKRSGIDTKEIEMPAKLKDKK